MKKCCDEPERQGDFQLLYPGMRAATTRALSFAWLAQTLKGGVMSGADSAAGWKALAELQYQNR